MAKIATPNQVAKAFNRMIETLEANLAARQAVESQKTEQAAGAGDEEPALTHDGSASEASS